MKPIFHAKISVKKWGGEVKDYIEIHKFLDSAKAHLPDVTHRAVLHNTFGIFLAERIFGDSITNSDGKEIAVRDIAENHVLEDCGFIPTLQDWFAKYKLEDWMLSQSKGANRKKVNEEPDYNKIVEDDMKKTNPLPDPVDWHPPSVPAPVPYDPAYEPYNPPWPNDKYPWAVRVVD